MERFFTKHIPSDVHKNVPLVTPERPPDTIPLDLNESYWLIDSSFLKKVSHIDTTILSSYPTYASLYKILARYTKLPESNLCIFNGSDAAIATLIQLLFKKGDSVLIPTPTFSIYLHMLKVLGVRMKTLPYNLKQLKSPQFPLEKTLSEIDNGAYTGLFLCNPSNPLGVSIPEDVMEELIVHAKRKSLMVVIDEAYFEFYGKTSIKKIRSFHNVIIIRTFSKAFGLAGVRLGYVAAHPDIIQSLLRLRLPWSVTHYSAHVGEIALQNQPYFKKRRDILLKTREFVRERLEAAEIIVFPSETNFLTAYTKFPTRVTKAFAKKKIAIHDLSKAPYSLKAVRFSIPAPEHTDYVLKACLSILKT